jgi:hypothetical protein
VSQFTWLATNLRRLSRWRGRLRVIAPVQDPLAVQGTLAHRARFVTTSPWRRRLAPVRGRSRC